MNNRSGRGGNNGRRAARRGGPDSDVLFEIKKYLRKVHRMRFDRILIEPVLSFRKGGRCVVEGTSMSQIEISGLAARHTIRNPDIVFVGKDGDPEFVIELDGSAHRRAKVARRDKIRNEHYRKIGLPMCAIDTRNLRSEGVAWRERIDEFIGSLPDRRG